MNLTCKIFYLSLSILLLYVSSMLLIYLATAVKCDQSLQQLICGLFVFSASDLLALRTEAEWEEVRQRICDLPQDEALTAEFNSKVPPSSIFSTPPPPPPPLPPRLIIVQRGEKCCQSNK